MKLTLEQAPKEKTRAEFAEETQQERQVIAELAVKLVAAELAKRQKPIHLIGDADKAEIIAHSVQMAFTIAKAVALEDVRRHGNRIDHV